MEKQQIKDLPLSNKNSIFLSWTGPFGKRVAEGLKRTLLSKETLTVKISSQDITSGSPWLEELRTMLSTSDQAIICLTPGASRKPWINFEAGFIFGKFQKIHLLRFGEKPEGFFQAIQSFDGYSEDDLQKLLIALLGNQQDGEAWHSFKKKEWEEDLKEAKNIFHQNFEHIETIESEFLEILSSINDHRETIGNVFLRDLMELFMSRVKESITNPLKGKELSISYVLYPYYLKHLLEKHQGPIVKAIALIDRDEHFWTESIAEEIRKKTSNDSTRIFVFLSKEQLKKNLDMLFRHAKRYNVAIISAETLANRFLDFNYDFSLIGGTGTGAILARYKDGLPYKQVQFSVSSEDVSQHADAFREINNCAVPITLDPAWGHEQFLESTGEIIEKTFKRLPRLSYEKKTIEMSKYIDPHEYDDHEENHAYFKEMKKAMIAIAQDLTKSQDKGFRILEMGAGTGLFTNQLAEAFSCEIFALEIDWACFKRLENKTKKWKQVTRINDDSRSYDPSGKFDLIFSSFADHHIRREDKSKYFRNVKLNLKPGAVFIVGDEFLPPYDRNSVESRREALRKYHGHIIAQAKKDGEPILAKLENEALESGLKEIGDFKLSCQEYEELLSECGFTFHKFPVSPQELEKSIGGVFIYQIEISKE